MTGLLTQGYEQLCNLIIRPPRFLYDLSDLGATRFRLGKNLYERIDLELVNPRGLTLQCSHYRLFERRSETKQTPLPCVIYSHGNCGSRLDGLETLKVLLPFCSVFVLDFSGSGLSEGEYISLGYFEKQDLQTVINYLRSNGNVSRIGLWGRSMGAATSLFYGFTDPSIAGMVLDSCFASLKKVAAELVEKSQFKIPKFMVSLGLKIIRKTIMSKAKFDINELEPVHIVDKCFIPALFIHADGDDFILPHHAKQLYEKYGGDKNLIIVDGDHNSMRPEFCYDSIAIFFHNTLFDKEELKNLVETDNSTTENYTNYPVLDSLMGMEETPENHLLRPNGSTTQFATILSGYSDETEDEEDAELQRAISESLKLSMGSIEENEFNQVNSLISSKSEEKTSIKNSKSINNK